MAQITPLMAQYHEIKKDYPDSLLFFQVGDFYELFFDDAKVAASYLGIALTARGKNKGEPIPLCGVPLHAIDHYVTKLIRGGFKLALCDQLEPPKPGTVVKRGVTQVLTPGTLTDAKLLDAKAASYLCALAPQPNGWGMVHGELLTGQLIATTISPSFRYLESELAKFFPDEIIIPNSKEGKSFFGQLKSLGFSTTSLDVSVDKQDDMQAWLAQQFSAEIRQTIARCEAMRSSLYYFYAYLAKNQPRSLHEFSTIQFYKPDDFLIMDAATQRNLELVKNRQDGSPKNTLFSVVDQAVTPMGSRLIKKWLQRPLVKKEAIIHRQEVVGLFVEQVTLFARVQEKLKALGDLERTVGRIALSRGQLHDYLHVAGALAYIPQLRQLIQPYQSRFLLQVITNHLCDFVSLKQVLDAALNDDLNKKEIIKNGFDQELDRLRLLVTSSQQAIAALEKKEQEATRISSLKIRYNQVQGYYIEITKTNLHLVPDHYKRLQTLVGKERFMTPELQQLQADILKAHNEIDQVEARLFDEVKKRVASDHHQLRKLSYGLAHLDALLSFARIAHEGRYICPAIHDGRDITIVQGRHPVVEGCKERFVPNDTHLNDSSSLWIITGPNMGGKSTYLRQVALIAILAHCGSFVPATQAEIPILDRIFTRIGSGDNLAEGKSTFLVEMEETAAICSDATNCSLVILDEVGRGTSTFDGLAIAQAVVEYLHTHIGARCLFATHYHELTQLPATLSGVANYYAASRKTGQGFVFLYQMVRGVANGSFGVEVAKLADLPDSIVARAESLVTQFDRVSPATPDRSGTKQDLSALPGIPPERDAILRQLEGLSVEEVSAREALDLLWRWKSLMQL